jgi:protein tyrosine phosphatase
VTKSCCPAVLKVAGPHAQAALPNHQFGYSLVAVQISNSLHLQKMSMIENFKQFVHCCINSLSWEVTLAMSVPMHQLEAG